MNSTMDRASHHRAVQGALALGRSTDPAALPGLVPLLAMPSAEIRRLAASAIGMLKKQQLYQQEGKRLISIHPADKPRVDVVLREKLALFGYAVPVAIPPAATVGSSLPASTSASESTAPPS